jgi:tetratricopeptide (TPR) repeat protein
VKLKIFIPALLTLLALSAPAYSESPEGLFYKGNELYSQGEYDKAVAAYTEIIEQGYENGNLYYNLGNSYFKMGEIGKALLNYERARRLIPRDSDLESNYRHARSLIKGSVPQAKRFWIIRFIYNTFGQFTINEITILMSIIYAFIIIALLLSIFLRIKRQVIIAALILAMLFVSASLTLAKKIDLSDKEGVIVKGSAEARFEPFMRATTHFTLYEGMKAQTISQREGWYKIKRRDGKIGWIEADTLEII